jgi:Calcineurin-like phosphoesterase
MTRLLATMVLSLLLAAAAQAGVWPKSDTYPVETLDHPTIESVLTSGDVNPYMGYHFVVFGDQRAQANGGWQGLIREINELPADKQPLFIIDTGDIVNAGKYSDQFHHLQHDILGPVNHLPYLVGVGNHELQGNKSREGLQNAATFLAYLDPAIGPERFWYDKVIGDVRFIFLNASDLVSGDNGRQGPLGVSLPGSRAEKQMDWFYGKLAEKGHWAKTIVISHYPIIQTSKSHREAAIYQWQYLHRGRRMVDVMIDAGVDVVLTGHTHTYERFSLKRPEGGGLAVINVSGKPHGRWERFFGNDRRAKDIRGREIPWLSEKLFVDLWDWTITQDEVMVEEEEANQFLLMQVHADGRLSGQVYFLDEDAPDGVRLGEEFQYD